MKALVFIIMLIMSAPAFAHEERSETDKIYVPILEHKLQKCNDETSKFKIKEEMLASCKVDLAKSQKEFFKMNVTWIKGVLVGIAMAIALI